MAQSGLFNALTLCSIALGCMTHLPAFAAERLVNGDAEAGNTSGWVAGGIDVVGSDAATELGLPSGMFLGAHAFTGGTGAATQTLSQTVSIADLATHIDSGVALYDFSILLQSRRLGTALDEAKGELRFLDADGALLDSLGFADRSAASGVFDWDWIGLSGAVPTFTRSIEVRLIATRNAGTSSDGFFDNAHLAISVVPEPAPHVLMLSGLCVLGLAARRAMA